MNKYAGIGSRQTPTNILTLMSNVASKLSNTHILRSGGSLGADQAFERGCSGKKEIFLANHCTFAAMELASYYHPNWDACNNYARQLHGRNMMIILGPNLDTPVDFVICWTSDGLASGGTGQALRLASAHNIKIFNLYNQKIVEMFMQRLKELE
jgi:hypothetical protein